MNYWSSPAFSPRATAVVTDTETHQQLLLNKHWDMYILLKNILECIFASVIVLIPYISRRNINVVVGSQSEHGQSSSSSRHSQQGPTRVHQPVTVVSILSQETLRSSGHHDNCFASDTRNYNSFSGSNESWRVVTPRSATVAGNHATKNSNNSNMTTSSATTEITYLL